MEKFVKKYDEKSIQDDINYNSKEFFAMAKAFRKMLERTFPEYAIAKFCVGHYYISGFLQRNGNYIYFSWNVPRHNRPIQLKNPIYLEDKLLFRTANSDNDYCGSCNNYTSVADMKKAIEKLYAWSYT